MANKPKSVAVDAKTGKMSGSSTYREPAAASITVKGSNGSITVARSTSPQVDLRASSYANMASQPRQAAPQQPQQLRPAIPESAFGTSSAQYGQVSPSGQVEVPPQSFNQQQSQSFGPAQSLQTPQQNKGLSSQKPVQDPFATGLQPTPIKGGVAYGVNPEESFISQTGGYQYPFFTAEGQGERLQNALATLNPFRLSKTLIAGKDVPGASEATTGLIWAVNAAAVLNAAGNLWNTYKAFQAVGATASAAGGAKALASTIPQAGGVVKETVKLAPVANTANTARAIESVTSLIGKNKLLSIGATITLLGMGVNGQTMTRKEASDYIEESGELAVKLREAGMDDLADEIAANNRELKDNLKTILPYIPYIGKNIITGDIQDYVDRLNEITLSYEAKVKADQEAEKQRAIAEDQAAEKEKGLQEAFMQEEQRRYSEAQKREQRAYNEAQEAEQRSYDEQRLAESRAYSAARQSEERSYALGLESTATEPAQPSALKFGLLHPGGSTEFVDRDKASQYYFSKTYTELTPEQQALLNKLKEEG